MKVGDYVRTDIGIGKYISDNEIQFRDGKGKATYRDVIKSSSNIIDLIEVGDYVNGYRVYEIKDNCIMVGYKCFKNEFDNEEDFLYQTIYTNDIKSIVTKECFESMEYKVGE